MDGPAKTAIKEILQEPAIDEAIDELTEVIVNDVLDSEQVSIEKPAVADFIEDSLSKKMDDPVPLLQDFVEEVKEELNDKIEEATEEL